MINRIRMIKIHRVLGHTLAKLGILSKNLKEDEFSPAGRKLDKVWGLVNSKEYVNRLYSKCLTPDQMNATQTLLIDDVRDIEADMIARNFQDGMRCLYENGPFATLYIDHDLASYDENGREKTGYDIVCWLEECPEYAPREIICVSANPVGRAKIQQVIDNIYRRRNEAAL